MQKSETTSDWRWPSPITEIRHFPVPRYTPLNTEIITLAAIDQDDGSNGEVLYSIADGEKQKFGIFPDGKVYLKEYLDRETKAYYAITVLAYDKGIPERSSTATVVVYVADENDNSPILVSENDVVYVDENSSPETVVGRVSASDADVGRNAELTYTFSNGMTSDNFLRVDSRTGKLLFPIHKCKDEWKKLNRVIDTLCGNREITSTKRQCWSIKQFIWNKA